MIILISKCLFLFICTFVSQVQPAPSVYLVDANHNTDENPVRHNPFLASLFDRSKHPNYQNNATYTILVKADKTEKLSRKPEKKPMSKPKPKHYTGPKKNYESAPLKPKIYQEPKAYESVLLPKPIPKLYEDPKAYETAPLPQMPKLYKNPNLVYESAPWYFDPNRLVLKLNGSKPYIILRSKCESQEDCMQQKDSKAQPRSVYIIDFRSTTNDATDDSADIPDNIEVKYPDNWNETVHMFLQDYDPTEGFFTPNPEIEPYRLLEAIQDRFQGVDVTDPKLEPRSDDEQFLKIYSTEYPEIYIKDFDLTERFDSHNLENKHFRLMKAIQDRLQDIYLSDSKLSLPRSGNRQLSDVDTSTILPKIFIQDFDPTERFDSHNLENVPNRILKEIQDRLEDVDLSAKQYSLRPYNRNFPDNWNETVHEFLKDYDPTEGVDNHNPELFEPYRLRRILNWFLKTNNKTRSATKPRPSTLLVVNVTAQKINSTTLQINTTAKAMNTTEQPDLFYPDFDPSSEFDPEANENPEFEPMLKSDRKFSSDYLDFSELLRANKNRILKFDDFIKAAENLSDEENKVFQKAIALIAAYVYKVAESDSQKVLIGNDVNARKAEENDSVVLQRVRSDESSDEDSEEEVEVRKPKVQIKKKKPKRFQVIDDSLNQEYVQEDSQSDQSSSSKEYEQLSEEITTKRPTKLRIPGRPDTVLQASTRIYKEGKDFRRRNNREIFLPKRYYWDEDDFKKLGYFWFNGPQGKDRAEA